MQSWTRRPSQCLFCQFRQIISESRQGRQRHSQPYRAFSSNPPVLAKDQRRLKAKDRLRAAEENGTRDRSRTKVHRISLQKQFTSPNDVGRQGHRDAPIKKMGFSLYRPNIEELQGNFHTQIQFALDNLDASFAAQTISKEERTEQLAPREKLDPDGKLWPAFVEQITKLRKPGRGNEQSPESRLWNRLFASFVRSKASLERDVYFEFLTFAFSPNAYKSPNESLIPVDLRYPTEWYKDARSRQRTIHLHVGPTNSGKTYNALKRLQESGDGFYAGPLRLLAHEVYSRFRANGIPCDLVTGDDVRLDDDTDTKVYASTVEMVSIAKECEVAVLDEIQMMGNEERGWAWTRAFLGANAKEVHLCGEARVVPLIRELAASMGDTLHIHHYERLNPLRATTRSLRGNLKALRKGDCIVAFSVMHIHELKKQIEVETGRHCAIVYGSLPPETRAEQADLFNNPDNDYDYLVASDAIGMGLNLSVKRIIFNKVHKFDGTKQVVLTVPQIKQIAGRAGRYRSAHDDKNKTALSKSSDKGDENVGLVTCLDEEDLPIIESALRTEAPPLRRAGVVPPAEFLEAYAQRLPVPVPFEYLMRKVSEEAILHPRFFQCDVRNRLELARIIDGVQNLTIEQRVNLTAAPTPKNAPVVGKCLKALAQIIADQRSVDIADVPEIPLEVLAMQPTADRSYLVALEALHQSLILYLWLSYRFMLNLRDRDMAMHAKTLTEQRINWTLRAFSANPKLRQRLKTIRKQQQHLTEGHFSTGPPTSEEQEPVDLRDAQPDQPAEAYEVESEAETDLQTQRQDSIKEELQEESFGSGEGGLDIGPYFSSPDSLIQLQGEDHEFATSKGCSKDMFEGESNLDIAPPHLLKASADDSLPEHALPTSQEDTSSQFEESSGEALVDPTELKGNDTLSTDGNKQDLGREEAVDTSRFGDDGLTNDGEEEKKAATG